MEKFRWVIIGCGSIANKVASELVKYKEFEICAVWNRTKQRAEQFAKKYGGKVFNTAEEALKLGDADCAYIATTHDRHLYYSKLAIQFGIPVLCEKPVTVNHKQAQEVINFAKEKGVYFAEAMWTWHNPVSLKVKEWITQNKIGEIKRFYASFAVPMVQFIKNPRLTTPDLIGGALLDIGIYPVRYALELFGKPKSVECRGVVSGGVDYEEKIIFKYDNFNAEIFVSMKRLKGEKLVIEGSDGKICVPLYHKAKSAKLTGKCSERFKISNLLYGLQLKNTAKEIKNGLKESKFCPFESTLETMALLDECRRQLGLKYPCE